jgi:ribonucleoside-diphosphate reductase alpha chain
MKDEMIDWLLTLKKEAVECNKKTAKKLGINQAAAVTCVKPSGTVSQLCDTASGIHPRFSKYYIRRVRGDVKDPLTQFMQKIGIPTEEDVTNKENVVFSFPMEAPDGSILVENVDAIEQLKIWQTYNDYYTEHKPSVTIYYTQDEFPEVCAYVWKHFDTMSGISFLPRDEHIYTQPPYEKIDKETYKKLKAEMPKTIDWKELAEFETGDNTTVQPELACTAGACEL